MKNSTLIALIMDRSGSIGDVLPQMQAAVTEFISAQKNLEGECDLLLAQFDAEYDIVYRGSIKDAPAYKIEPRGSTALLDAIGKTVIEVGEELAAREEADRPDKVMFVIITDGFENASRYFSKAKIREMITHQTEKYSWNFDFLGANQDAVLVGEEIGVQAANAMSFATSVAGTRSVSASLSAKAATYRDTGTYTCYDSDMRKSAMATDEDDPSLTTTTSGLVGVVPPVVVKHPSSVDSLLKNTKVTLGGGKKTRNSLRRTLKSSRKTK
jgi:hypothetical protein